MNQAAILMHNDPRKHHFVPECYLRKFIANKELHVLNIDSVKKWGQIKINYKQPSTICFLDNFYLIKSALKEKIFDLSAYSKLYIEVDLFQLLENTYGNIIQKLTETSAITRDEATKVSDFIIQLKIRNPAWRNTMQGILNTSIDKIVDDIINDPQTRARFHHDSPEELIVIAQIMKARILGDPTLMERAHKFSIIERFEKDSIRNAAFRKAILGNRWTILQSPVDGPFFITTDNPGVGVNNEECLNTNFVVGVFYLPISYKHCLRIENVIIDSDFADSSTHKRCNRLDATPSEVLAINNYVKEVANQLIIASDSNYLISLAEEIIITGM